jgi:hypothetical protein
VRLDWRPQGARCLWRQQGKFSYEFENELILSNVKEMKKGVCCSLEVVARNCMIL